MKTPLFLFSFMIAIYFISCSDNGPGPDGSGPLFEAKVVDTAGTPVAGLRIGSINHFDYLEKPAQGPVACPTTGISFALPSSGYVTLTIFDYYSNLVETLLDSALLEAGEHLVTWDASGAISGFYRYSMSAWNNDTLTLFSEKWMLLEFGPDAVKTLIGTTDSNGVFVTDDTLLFPCLLGAPPTITRTHESGHIIDTIYDFYEDTVTITLSDSTEPEKFMYFERALKVSQNKFELMWDTTQAQ